MRIGPIENDVPLPMAIARGISAALRAMQPGQSIFIAGAKTINLSSRISEICKSTGAKYTCRARVENGVKGVRVWRVS